MALRTKGILLLLTFLLPLNGYTWGFFAHQRINRLAVFTQPPEMIGFSKKQAVELYTEDTLQA